MKGQMAMSLLDGLKRKKKKHIREQLLDAPTLFGGLSNDAQNAEKKISVLSAAGGKSARRGRNRRAPERSGSLIRPFYVVLLIGTIALGGGWQAGVFNRDSAVTLASKFDALLQTGIAVFAPSDSASAHAAVAQSPAPASPAATDTDSADTGRADREARGAPASIERVAERVALANGAASRVPGEPVPAAGSIEAALSRTDPVVEVAPPAAAPRREAKKAPVSTPPLATSRSHASGASAPAARGASAAAGTPPQAAKAKPAPEQTAERKVQVARSKEPDPDAQLMEALLLHLKKMETAKGGAH